VYTSVTETDVEVELDLFMTVKLPPPVLPLSNIVDQPAVSVGLAVALSVSTVQVLKVMSFVVGVAASVCVSAPSAMSVVLEVTKPLMGVVELYPTASAT
jgi:hypothetical protein